MNSPDFGLTPPPADDLPLVLVIDDEVRSQEAMRRTLDEDFRVIVASDTAEAAQLLQRHSVDVVLCDQRMPGQTGVAFLKEMREQWPNAVRILVSGYTDSQDIIAGVNEAGIYQYILKPWTPSHLLNTVKSAVEASRLQHSLHRLELDLRAGGKTLRERRSERLREARQSFDFERIGRAPGSPMDALCAMALRIARFDLSVLVLGESGTGKELMARGIHFASPRQAGPFVVENCAAIPDTLLESELFGHKRGAFTGAFEDHPGLFQRANGGTVFLDEIGETSPAFQVKLLRVLQEGEVRPVGAARSLPVDVRVIAATHRDLEAEVRAGRFRQDLYYRIAGVTLGMPALRERPGDILPIAEQLLVDVAAELGLPPAQFDADSRALLMGYAWPGNIRELRSEIARALVLSDSSLIHSHALSHRLLSGQGRAAGQPGRGSANPGGVDVPSAAASVLAARSGTLQERMDAIEAVILREVMIRLRWNKTRAAEELGLSRMGLRAKLQRFGLEGG